MSQLGSCHHCNNEWYTLTRCMKVRRPMHIPTCPEGAIMAVCDDCFDASTSEEIIAVAIRAYRKSQMTECDASGDSTDHRMTPTEHLLVEASIRSWVPFMKGETSERPYDQEALRI